MHLSDIDVPPARAEQAAEQAAAGGRVGASVCITTHQTFFAVVKTSILSGTSPTAPAAHGSAAIGGHAGPLEANGEPRLPPCRRRAQR
jgi:hypothetical protein